MKILFVFSVIAILFGCSDKNQEDPPKTDPKIENPSPQKHEVDYKGQINDALRTISNTSYIASFHQDQKSMIGEVEFFSDVYHTITISETDSDIATKKMATQLKRKLISLQIAEFPKLRKDYINKAAELGWEEDMKVKGSGVGNSTIIFIHSAFAANKNKAEFQSKLESILTKLRFKRSIYKWFDYEEQYTYYDMKSPKDAELINQ